MHDKLHTIIQINATTMKQQVYECMIQWEAEPSETTQY